MTHLKLALIFSLLAGAFAPPATTYNNAVSGHLVGPGVGGRIIITGGAEGDLPGPLQIRLDYDPASGAVTGGTWSLNVVRPGADGAPQVTGSLRGEVTGGTVTLDETRRPASYAGVQLAITGGDGSAAGAAGGGGSFSGSKDARDPRGLSGDLSLTF